MERAAQRGVPCDMVDPLMKLACALDSADDSGCFAEGFSAVARPVMT